MTFKHVDDRAMQQDIMAMVERPITRAGLREDESRALAILEDPIEFAQNIIRTLQGGELGGVLHDAMPVTPSKMLREMQGMLRDAIARRDWEAASKISDKLDNETTAATITAQEYGIAQGAVMEQLRTGLLEVERLRNAGMTRADRHTAETIAELGKLVGRDSGQEAHTHTQAAD